MQGLKCENIAHDREYGHPREKVQANKRDKTEPERAQIDTGGDDGECGQEGKTKPEQLSSKRK